MVHAHDFRPIHYYQVNNKIRSCLADKRSAAVTEAETEAHVWKFHKELSAGIVSLVLLAVLANAKKPMYGYQIAKRLEQTGGGVLSGGGSGSVRLPRRPASHTNPPVWLCIRSRMTTRWGMGCMWRRLISPMRQPMCNLLINIKKMYISVYSTHAVPSACGFRENSSRFLP